MPFLTVAGARAHHVHRRPVPASGPPVVFVHGAGGTHQHWLYQVRDLPHSPTYALDLPGHGRSEGQGRDSISAYGDWLIDFLDAAGEDQAVLVGHSMGGAIVLDTTLRHPERVVVWGWWLPGLACEWRQPSSMAFSKIPRPRCASSVILPLDPSRLQRWCLWAAARWGQSRPR